ncbi:hypothetical protein Acid345_1919 [Candidatus Koribacter versatilis Ellin345]|uniref:Uncharacterized protein n=1 Tax=Koribacter versatilis (strain Ellin345) TaxID=204669 RepID=Q1IQD0_KORVE|nr:hypothetical protein [Candidatus Koribacter versatilis]ABF40920.1 hypothetical protein Acid345_1919 [Candidatus Koribacter versatilis Ellin345]
MPTASHLRREIIVRNQRRVRNGAEVGVKSYGRDEVVVYSESPDGRSHGNFFPESYAAILKRPEWRRRLAKVHTGRRNLPNTEKWKELDACTSSDALLMNIFCHPETLAEGKLRRLMSVDMEAEPEFGVRVAAPLQNGHRDRTEVDMRWGDLLVEAKLTETDFQCCREELVERYRDFDELFDAKSLARGEAGYANYQLIRGVLAAASNDDRFCVIADARRPDLRERWFAVMQSVRSYDLRMRCQMLTWQEICAVLPEILQQWLGEKYGIFTPGTEPTMDAEEWYW